MGKGRLKVVMCPCWGNEPASGHPRVQQPPLGRVPPPLVWGVCLPLANGKGCCPSVWTQHSAVKVLSGVVLPCCAWPELH